MFEDDVRPMSTAAALDFERQVLSARTAKDEQN